MATPDKETLTAEVSELHAQLKTQFEKSKVETLSQGRSFNPLGWWAGAPESQKYPPGPAFVVRPCLPITCTLFFSSYNWDCVHLAWMINFCRCFTLPTLVLSPSMTSCFSDPSQPPPRHTPDLTLAASWTA